MPSILAKEALQIVDVVRTYPDFTRDYHTALTIGIDWAQRNGWDPAAMALAVTLAWET